MRLPAFALALLVTSCRTPDPWEQLLGAHEAGARQIEPGLAIECEPGDSELVIDGVLQGSCDDVKGHILALVEGTHRVEVTKPGHRPYQVMVATGRARTKLRVQLVAN